MTWIRLLSYAFTLGLGATFGLLYEGCKRGGSLDLHIENLRLAKGYTDCVEERRAVILRSVSPDNPPTCGDAA